MKSTFTTLTIEGGLIGYDIIERIASGEECGQKPSDFGFDSKTRLSDEIAAAWSDARDFWHAFKHRLDRMSENDPATSITRDQWIIPLLSSLGYELIYQPKASEVDGLTFAISHRAGKDESAPPVHIVGARQSLDRRPDSGRPRLAPHSLVQEYLNRTEHVWGIVTNGRLLRILRDSQRMRKQSYIEFDLEQMMESEKFADFALLYRILHRTRLPKSYTDSAECFLEKYYLLTVEQGGRVRDRLRDGVEKAIKIFANGFIKNPNNESLRHKILAGNLNANEYYRQILRLIYRLLFLMVAEERKLITDNPIYLDYYSVTRLRGLLEQRSCWNDYMDLWQGLRTTFMLFRDEEIGKYLGVSPLNGALFNDPDLVYLESLCLLNRELLSALWHISMYRPDERSPWHRINYAYIDVEELGSVYESLLEFYPVFIERSGDKEFELVYGTERKSTGSYYTPPELVQELIKSALVPVIEERLKESELKESALLSIKVLDPACGSGHFLLAAARRLGKELAKIRTGEDEPAPEPYRLAVRDVITHCIYGVDKNPLAVDLCQVALWIEGHAKGKPLTFLDHRIRCGDSLVGVVDLNVLKEGIPDDAFNPVEGDDKAVARRIKNRNREERRGNRLISFIPETELQEIESQVKPLYQLPDDTPKTIREKQETYGKLRSENTKWYRDFIACDLWTAAFFTELSCENEIENKIPTSGTLMTYLDRSIIDLKTVEHASNLAKKQAYFHWPLEFPEVFKQGGFDIVIGNPPWERIKLQEEEFFSSRDPEISTAPNKAVRSRLINDLKQKNPDLWKEYKEALHRADALSKFIRVSGRFPLTGCGDINIYSIFSELALRLIKPNGRAGIVIPTGIATDYFNKCFFLHIVEGEKLVSLYDFENREKLFPAVDSRQKFCLLTISNRPVAKSDFAFFLLRAEQLNDDKRRFNLTPQDFIRLNPNTKTCPIFRTKIDAEITKKIYERVPVLINEQTGENPWGISFLRMFDMANDSHLFRTRDQLEKEGYRLFGNRFVKGDDIWLPLYEAKMIWQYDHRFGTFEEVSKRSNTHLPTPDIESHKNPSYVVIPWYWVNLKEVAKKNDLSKKKWMIGWRDVTNATNERTTIVSAFPISAVSGKLPIILSDDEKKYLPILIANLNSIVLDYISRQKVGGISFSMFIMEQLPILEPNGYSSGDLIKIISCVIEMIYTAWDIKPFADDIWKHSDDEIRDAIKKQWEENKSITGGHSWNPPEWAEIDPEGIPLPPFKWDEDRRAKLKAELDAYYAKLYGLTRDELLYILDPQEVYGPDFPGETFRVLKEKEVRVFREYRTKRLILEAWDRQNS
ncbi:MAG: Eco57I restriction-modification methylase domain-containing protein [Candidatus Saccharicenans sp.]